MQQETLMKSIEMFPLVESKECSVYQMKNETGEGTMTMYQVFPGVSITYNDFHMRYYNSTFSTDRNLFCIDHCREGRLEYPAGKGAYSYVEAGDLKLDRRLEHRGYFEFPLSHYHGLMISFDMNLAVEALPKEMKDFPIALPALQRKYCTGKHPMVLHGASSMEHIFSELYTVPDKIKLPYFKIKTFELLLYLDALELPKSQEDKPYFYKKQVEKIKAIQTLMTENLEKHYTQEELSECFDIPLTPMKNCFKHVFGSPINTYMRVFRMNQAAILLRNKKDNSVAEIAGTLGYDSPSKFAAAFKDIMGKSPLEYRKTYTAYTDNIIIQ